MAITITETKKSTRPNTSVEFFINSSALPANVIASNQSLRSDGSYTTSANVSEDELTQTLTNTFTSLAAYSTVDTNISLYLDSEYIKYTAEHGFVTIARPDQYTQSGITQPFSCTTTYTFPTACAEIDTISGWIEGQNETSHKLANLSVVGTTVTAVHNYSNSADFTLTHFSDFHFVTELAAAGAVRTIRYDLL